MTTPTAPGSKVENATAELQRKIAAALADSSIKTDMLDQLLRSSPEYAKYLVASTEKHTKDFAALGVGADASSSQAKAWAEADARAVIAHPIEALRAQAAENDQMLSFLEQEADRGIRNAQEAIAAIDKVLAYEFMSSITSRNFIKINFKRETVDSSVSVLNSALKQVATLRSAMADVAKSDSESVARAAVTDFKKKVGGIEKSIGDASRTIADAIGNVSATIDKAALESLVRKIKDEELERLDMSKDWVERFMSVTGAFFKKTNATGALQSGAELLSLLIHERLKHDVIEEGAAEHKAGHTRAQISAEHTKNPLLLANDLIERQKRALEIFLKGLETTLTAALIPAAPVGDAVMQGWSPIAEAIKQFIESRLRERLRLAAEKLEQANKTKDEALVKEAQKYQTDANDEIEKDFRDGLIDYLRDRVKDYAEAAGNAIRKHSEARKEFKDAANFFSNVKKNPGDFTASIVNIAMPLIMPRVWKIFPPKPAQAITGEDLDGMQNILFDAFVLPVGVMIAESAEPPLPGVPFDDAQAPDVPSELFSKFAGTDRDRSRNVGDPAKSIYRVAITMPDFGGVKVWGDFNPRKHEFVPVEIDALTLDDWSKRTITGDGFTEGALIPKPGEKAKAAVTGEWVVVKVGTASEHQSTERRYVWLKGTKHWGSYMARTLGPKGTASLLGNIVDELGSKHTSKRMPARISMG